MIPRIIHQTWKDAKIPPEWVGARRTWRFHHPDWSHRLWTDEDNRLLVANHYPRLLDWYDRLPYQILKADVARILILEHCGGVYADLDTECLRPLGPLLENMSMVVGLEPRSHARQLGERRVLSNAVIASSPGHPFVKYIVKAFEASRKEITTHRDVLEQTGPLFLSRLYSARPSPDVTLLPNQVFSPLESADGRLKTLKRREPGWEAVRERCISIGAYVVHYWGNSWVGTLAGELHNPRPHDVPGFRFFPGLDSDGFDIGNGGRDIAALARQCLEDDAVVAFNTDGFMKNRIRPKNAWRQMPSPGQAEGLYVRENFKIPDSALTGFLQRCWRRAVRIPARGPTRK